MNTNKKIIKKRILEFVIEAQENIKYGEIFPNEFDTRISKTIKLREKYSDIIPFTEKEKQDAIDYLNALNAEDYETCNDFIII